MVPPPGYTAAAVWHPDFPPRELIDCTVDAEGKAVAWRSRAGRDMILITLWGFGGLLDTSPLVPQLFLRTRDPPHAVYICRQYGVF